MSAFDLLGQAWTAMPDTAREQLAQLLRGLGQLVNALGASPAVPSILASDPSPVAWRTAFEAATQQVSGPTPAACIGVPPPTTTPPGWDDLAIRAVGLGQPTVAAVQALGAAYASLTAPLSSAIHDGGIRAWLDGRLGRDAGAQQAPIPAPMDVPRPAPAPARSGGFEAFALLLLGALALRRRR